MGHGTEAESNGIYEKMQKVLADQGFANYYVGTVEAAPSLDDVLAMVQQGEYKRVVLQPLMVEHHTLGIGLRLAKGLLMGFVAAVVYDDDFEILVGLVYDRIQTAREILLDVVHWN
jgi:hypothetical protein